jgi:signal peptidase I
MIRRFAAGALAAGTAWLCLTPGALAHSIETAPTEAVAPSFDIVETSIVTKGDVAVFTTRVRGEAGKDKPDATGKFEGSEVYAYVWPTSLDSGEIGFEKAQGIVALAVTFHPDFDDAAKGGKNRHVWHPHWVVLAKDDACGAGLKVVDIPKDTKPKVPDTWPGVPLLIDSPDYPTTLKGDAVDVTIPLSLIGGLKTASFDGVTAGLKVNGNLHAPLLCVANVFKVASGNLSLPGKVEPAK